MPRFAHLPLAHRTSHLDELTRIKTWLRAHRHDQAVEYQAMDAVLFVWLMGWVGALPAMLLGAWWLLPLCAVCAYTPTAYVQWRLRCHTEGQLRCEWAHLAHH
jgi:hypothetical protein